MFNILYVWNIRNESFLNNLLLHIVIIFLDELQEILAVNFIYFWMTKSRNTRFWQRRPILPLFFTFWAVQFRFRILINLNHMWLFNNRLVSLYGFAFFTLNNLIDCLIQQIIVILEFIFQKVVALSQNTHLVWLAAQKAHFSLQIFCGWCVVLSLLLQNRLSILQSKFFLNFIKFDQLSLLFAL